MNTSNDLILFAKPLIVPFMPSSDITIVPLSLRSIRFFDLKFFII